ncbi:hypothetical protein [Streptomyces paromomycinus]|uniref:Lipoprotein n=1 Tax=Streptomyces paromomycinus TaxID=92743 RepID=A0A401VYQ2_STREY|nr:hypothetical protein [Streptomyces paromomycinus]GCD42218.1 hypothetical protein GKJPGBOP_01876 [Streptomyces paromomycinus]
MKRKNGIALLALAAGTAHVWLTGCAGDNTSAFEELDASTFEVVYEVTGSDVRTVTYEGGAKRGTSSASIDDPEVPWKKEVALTGIATSPNVSLMLGEKGGQADCVIYINGKEVKRATARGAFGTASCVAASPGATRS